MVFRSTTASPKTDPVAAYHVDLINDPTVTVDVLAAHFRVCLDLVIHSRKALAPISAKRMAVEPVLDDPANDDHPARLTWELQYGDLIDDEREAIQRMLFNLHGMQQMWSALTPNDRIAQGLDGLIGLNPASQTIDDRLACKTDGPLQDASPLLAEWRIPDTTVAQLSPVLRMLVTGDCPF